MKVLDYNLEYQKQYHAIKSVAWYINGRLNGHVIASPEGFEEIADELYRNSTDEAHAASHIVEVYNTAIQIARKVYNRDITACEEVAILLHDVTSYFDRDKHNVSGAKLFMEAAADGVPTDAVVTVASCIMKHRSSYKGELTISEEIVSSADRERPRFDDKITRSFKYNMGKGMPLGEAVANVVAHVVKKYGSLGNAKFPNAYTKAFETEMIEYRRLFDNLTSEDVINICTKSGLIK